MKYFVLFFTFFTVTLQSQVRYENGYFIDNNGNKIDCLIKNMDWKNSPESFSYKLLEDSEPNDISIDSVLEFRILNTDQYYVRFKLVKPLKLKNTRFVKTTNDVIFLKVLLKGEATLFEYQNYEDFFFFSLENNPPKYLPFEKHVDENNKIIESNQFRKVLFDNLKCDKFSVNTLLNLEYVSDELVDFFEEYNKCKNEDFEDIYNSRTKASFGLKLNGGVHFNSKLSNEYAYSYSYDDPPSLGGDRQERFGERSNSFDPKSNFAFGVEAELLLPFDRNKWGVFINPNYQSISKAKGTSNFTEEGSFNFNYSSELSYSFIEIPIGLRYYFNLNDKMQLFTQVAYTQYVVLSSDENQEFEANPPNNIINFESKLEPLGEDQKENYGGFLGLGLNYNTKFSLAVNYYFSKNIKINDNSQSSSDGTISLVASYSVF